MTEDYEEMFVCHACVGDAYLKNTVRSEGARRKCSFCGKSRKSLSVSEFADIIHDVLQEHFYLTSSEPEGLDYLLAKEGHWERPGELVEDVIGWIASIDSPIAEAVKEYLSDQHGYMAVRDGEEDPYGDDALYEEKGIDDWDFQETWKAFKDEITSQARYFSQFSNTALDEIFGDIDRLSRYDGTSVVRTINPNDEDRYVFRARVCFSEKELKEMLIDPAKQLGPPPSENAKAGRMNARGITVFYGAIDEETCIAEVRAPVGSYVVLGRFEIIKPIRLLDFDILTKAYVEGSHFDPEYGTRCKRVSFLKKLVDEISRPVMPRDEEFEYIPTQAVAEYLAARDGNRLDGIIFHSSQTDKKGKNLALFHHVSQVEPYELPEGTEVDVFMGWATEDDYDDSITILEAVPENLRESKKDKKDVSPLGFLTSKGEGYWDSGSEDYELPKAPYLRLDIESVRVCRVRRVNYEITDRSVSRDRRKKRDITKF